MSPAERLSTATAFSKSAMPRLDVIHTFPSRVLGDQKSCWVKKLHGSQSDIDCLLFCHLALSLLHHKSSLVSLHLRLKSTFHFLPSVFHLATYGHSASCFHCYINVTNPFSVRNDADTEKDDIISPSGLSPKTRKLVQAEVFWAWRGYSRRAGHREEINNRCQQSLITLS